MKNKIYSKLFKYSDTKSWDKDTSILTYQKLYSNFYPEYKLYFITTDMAWSYQVDKNAGRGTYSSTKIHKGVITLNFFGKTIFTVVGTLILSLLSHMIFDMNPINLKLTLGIFLALVILSNFAISIFNWDIYRKFRKVNSYVKKQIRLENKKQDKLKQEEEDRITNQLKSAISEKLESDPKLARKMKLKNLNKSL